MKKKKHSKSFEILWHKIEEARKDPDFIKAARELYKYHTGQLNY